MSVRRMKCVGVLLSINAKRPITSSRIGNESVVRLLQGFQALVSIGYNVNDS